MATGLDIIVGRAAVSAGMKAGGWSGQGALGFLQRRKAKRYLASYPETKDLQELISSQSEAEQSAIEGFFESPEFEHVALNIAIASIIEPTLRGDSRLERIESELVFLLKLRLTVDADKIAEIASAIFGSLCWAIARFSAEVIATRPMSPKLRAGLVRTVASSAAASARNETLLKNGFNISSVEQFEDSLRRQVRALYSTMRLPHAGTKRQIPYSRLFVPPELKREEFTQNEESSGRTSISEMVFSSLRPVILGDPGGGKSTLALKIAFDIASGKLESTKARVPFFVVLREHTKDFRENSHTLIDYLTAACRSPLNLEPPRDVVEYLLLNGRAIVILDGLDELTDTALRERVVRLVEGFAHLYPTVQIVVTSREIGYDQAPLDSELFETFHLAPFTYQQVASYAENWFTLDDNVERNRQESLTKSFLEESEFASDLRENPLMLSLMCGIYASERYIPKNRPEMYEKCAVVLFERWDKQRGIQAMLPFDAHVRQAMRSLALWLYEDPARQDGLTRGKLIAFVKAYLLKKRYDDEIEAEDAASSFVDFCTGRAWVLTDLGSDPSQSLFGFTHRTFLEYFAASQLVRENSSARTLYRRLKKRIVGNEWDVVSQLSLQILGQNVEDGSDDFLSLLASDATKATGENKKNIISFLARSLTFIVPRPDLIRKICDLCLDEFEHSGTGERSSLPDLLTASEENLPSISRSLIDAAAECDTPLRSVRLLPLLHPWKVIEYRSFERKSTVPSHTLEFWRKQSPGIRDELTSTLDSLEESVAWINLIRVTEGRSTLYDFNRLFGLDGLVSSRIAPRITLQPPLQSLLIAAIDGGADWPAGATVDSNKIASEFIEILSAMDPPWFSYLDHPRAIWHIDLQKVMETQAYNPTQLFTLAAIYLEYAEMFFGRDSDPFIDEIRPKSGTLKVLLSHRKSAAARPVASSKVYDLLAEEGVKEPFLGALADWSCGRVTFFHRGDNESSTTGL